MSDSVPNNNSNRRDALEPTGPIDAVRGLELDEIERLVSLHGEFIVAALRRHSVIKNGLPIIPDTNSNAFAFDVVLNCSKFVSAVADVAIGLPDDASVAEYPLSEALPLVCRVIELTLAHHSPADLLLAFSRALQGQILTIHGTQH